MHSDVKELKRLSRSALRTEHLPLRMQRHETVVIFANELLRTDTVPVSARRIRNHLYANLNHLGTLHRREGNLEEAAKHFAAGRAAARKAGNTKVEQFFHVRLYVVREAKQRLQPLTG